MCLPYILKIVILPKPTLYRGITKPAEWNKSAIEFVVIAHKLRLIEDEICFNCGAGTRELAVPIVLLADLHLLVKQVHVALNHAGHDKVLKMAEQKCTILSSPTRS